MKISAYGTTLVMNGDDIAQVTNISGPSFGLDTVDVTTHDQANAWEQHIATLLRSGTVTVDIVYDPDLSSHADTLGAMVGKDAESFELNFPDPAKSQYLFDAFVTGFTPSAPVDGALTASVTLKITGEPTLVSNWS